MMFAEAGIVQHPQLWFHAATRAPGPGLSASVSLSLHLLSLSYTHREIQAHSDLRPLLIWGKTAASVLPQARRAPGPLRDTLLRLQSDSPESGGKLMMSLEQELLEGLSPPWTPESTRLPEPENWRI